MTTDLHPPAHPSTRRLAIATAGRRARFRYLSGAITRSGTQPRTTFGDTRRASYGCQCGASLSLLHRPRPGQPWPAHRVRRPYVRVRSSPSVMPPPILTKPKNLRSDANYQRSLPPVVRMRMRAQPHRLVGAAVPWLPVTAAGPALPAASADDCDVTVALSSMSAQIKCVTRPPRRAPSLKEPPVFLPRPARPTHIQTRKIVCAT
jgi:hypothetical protein